MSVDLNSKDVATPMPRDGEPPAALAIAEDSFQSSWEMGPLAAAKQNVFQSPRPGAHLSSNHGLALAESLVDSPALFEPAPSEGADPQGRDPIFRAIEAGASLEAIQSLAHEPGTNALSRTMFHKGLAHAAAARPDGAVMDFVLAFGASPTAADVNGSQPLHECHKGDSAHAAQLLIEAGADINARDSMEMTPLMSAAISRRNSKVALLLIERGALLDGALDLALSTPQPNAVVDALIAAGARSEPHPLSRTAPARKPETPE